MMIIQIKNIFHATYYEDGKFMRSKYRYNMNNKVEVEQKVKECIKSQKWRKFQGYFFCVIHFVSFFYNLIMHYSFPELVCFLVKA